MTLTVDRVVNVILTVLLVALFILSVAASWYRYVEKEQFRYFLTEEEAPARFDLSTY